MWKHISQSCLLSLKHYITQKKKAFNKIHINQFNSLNFWQGWVLIENMLEAKELTYNDFSSKFFGIN